MVGGGQNPECRVPLCSGDADPGQGRAILRLPALPGLAAKF